MTQQHPDAPRTIGEEEIGQLANTLDGQASVFTDGSYESQLLRSAAAALRAQRPAAGSVSEAQVKHMVDRFLGWRLPEAFHPDSGISFKPTFNEHTAYPMRHEPMGTNLFDATQATAMVRYMLDGLPVSEAAAPSENGHEWIKFWPDRDLISCRKCGIVRRADGNNKPCRGVVHVELRDAPLPALALPAAPASAEPVAWQGRDMADGWITWAGVGAESAARVYHEETDALIRPLYAAPPPAAGADALRERTIEECAKVADAMWNASVGMALHEVIDSGYRMACREIAYAIRALSRSSSSSPAGRSTETQGHVARDIDGTQFGPAAAERSAEPAPAPPHNPPSQATHALLRRRDE